MSKSVLTASPTLRLDAARVAAQKDLAQYNTLTERSKLELISAAAGDANLSVRDLAVLRSALEIICAARVIGDWVEIAASEFKKLPVVALGLARERLGWPVEPHSPLAGLPETIDDLATAVGYWEFNQTPTVFFDKTKALSEEQKLLAHKSLLAVARAVSAGLTGDVSVQPAELAAQVSDTDAKWAADFADQSYSPAVYWTWCMNEGLHAAVAKANAVHTMIGR